MQKYTQRAAPQAAGSSKSLNFIEQLQSFLYSSFEFQVEFFIKHSFIR